MVSTSSSLLDQLFAVTPLADSSASVKALSLAIALPLIAIVLNVASQLLLPAPRNNPPVVFHFDS